jgi:gamma-glutamyltranspeptidase
VPGALAGAYAAWRSAGWLRWEQLFEPALTLAAGHQVTPWMAKSYRSVVDRGHGAALAAFLDQDEVPNEGDQVSCSRFARTLSRVAAGGAEEFYRGSLGAELIAAAAADGAYLSADDLRDMKAVEAPAERYDVGDTAVWVPPPPSQAGIVPRLMAAAESADHPGSVAFADATAAVAERELIDRCIVGVPGTAASVATDGSSVAAIVHSLAGVQFGTGWVAGDTGVAFGNRLGTALSTRPDLPAANPQPGGVLPHTLSAALLRRGDRTLLVATPGGDRQVQWLAQAAQRFRRGDDIESIVTGPRWFVCPEGDRFGVPGGIGKEWFLFAEPEIEWFAEATVAGYTVRQTQSVGGGLQAVERNADGWFLASDPRSGGAALVDEPADV